MRLRAVRQPRTRTTTAAPASASTSCARGGGIVYYRHRFYVDDLAPGFDSDDPATWQFAVPLTAEPDHELLVLRAGQLEGRWRSYDQRAASAGKCQDVRRPRRRDRRFKLNDNWAPRLGFVWDVAQNGRSKLYANYGRFFESIPMDINIRAFGGEVHLLLLQLQPDPANFRPGSPRHAGAHARCLAAQSRSIPTSRASTSTSSWSASSTRWRQPGASAPSSRTASSAA